MVVIIKRSTCVACNHIDKCNILKRINKVCKSYEDSVDHIDVIIDKCSIKDRKNVRKKEKKEDGNGWYMYYCEHCHAMHRNNSKIGILHKAMIDKKQ